MMLGEYNYSHLLKGELLCASFNECTRGGFGSGGSGFGEIRCPSVENKFTDNPSANRPLIGSGGRVG